ncbi:hypothetical protein ACN20G_27585 (plasmid) [Streptomyces sp. BI20]|uniref:hypothetical protein n=1 Tax=Streptomyces sp. BI20 TaxID=3403460 RepID=UPI003C758EF4
MEREPVGGRKRSAWGAGVVGVVLAVTGLTAPPAWADPSATLPAQCSSTVAAGRTTITCSSLAEGQTLTADDSGVRIVLDGPNDGIIEGGAGDDEILVTGVGVTTKSGVGVPANGVDGEIRGGGGNDTVTVQGGHALAEESVGGVANSGYIDAETVRVTGGHAVGGRGSGGAGNDGHIEAVNAVLRGGDSASRFGGPGAPGNIRLPASGASSTSGVVNADSVDSRGGVGGDAFVGREGGAGNSGRIRAKTVTLTGGRGGRPIEDARYGGDGGAANTGTVVALEEAVLTGGDGRSGSDVGKPQSHGGGTGGAGNTGSLSGGTMTVTGGRAGDSFRGGATGGTGNTDEGRISVDRPARWVRVTGGDGGDATVSTAGGHGGAANAGEIASILTTPLSTVLTGGNGGRNGAGAALVAPAPGGIGNRSGARFTGGPGDDSLTVNRGRGGVPLLGVSVGSVDGGGGVNTCVFNGADAVLDVNLGPVVNCAVVRNP